MQKHRVRGARWAVAAAVALLPSAAVAQSSFSLSVIAAGLERPSGIVADRSGNLFFTQLPTPGVGGGVGGTNKVSRMDGRTGAITTLTLGEPEPTNLALDNHGDLYWTCKSAGVILTLSKHAPAATLVLAGLAKPSGIAIDVNGRGRGTLYFTQIPTPGVGGGMNGVFQFDGSTVAALHMGEPEPTDIAVDNHGDLYWTCKSAGVILKLSNGVTSLVLAGLSKPTGIALDHRGNLYFTEVPTPGVPGSMGGTNKVWRYDLRRSELMLVHAGDPEPTDITVAPNGTLYWTCTIAGVIVQAVPRH